MVEECRNCTIRGHCMNCSIMTDKRIKNLEKEMKILKDRNNILEQCRYANTLEIKSAELREADRWRNKIREKITEMETLRKLASATKNNDKYAMGLNTAYAYSIWLFKELLKGE